MVVEGDDGRARLAGARLRDEPLQQVQVPEMEAVEHADDDERGAQIRREGIDARDDVHRRRVRRASRRAAGAGLTNTLSGASRFVPLRDAIATSAPSGPRSR